MVAGVVEAAPKRLGVPGVDDVLPPALPNRPPAVAAGLAAPPNRLLPPDVAPAWPNGLLAACVVPGAAALDCPNKPPPLVVPAPDPPIVLFELALPKEKPVLPVEAPKRLLPVDAAGAVVLPKRPPAAGADVFGWLAGPLEAGVPKENAIVCYKYAERGYTVDRCGAAGDSPPTVVGRKECNGERNSDGARAKVALLVDELFVFSFDCTVCPRTGIYSSTRYVDAVAVVSRSDW